MFRLAFDLPDCGSFGSCKVRASRQLSLNASRKSKFARRFWVRPPHGIYMDCGVWWNGCNTCSYRVLSITRRSSSSLLSFIVVAARRTCHLTLYIYWYWYKETLCAHDNQCNKQSEFLFTNSPTTISQSYLTKTQKTFSRLTPNPDSILSPHTKNLWKQTPTPLAPRFALPIKVNNIQSIVKWIT